MLTVSIADLLTALAIWAIAVGSIGFALGYFSRLHHDHKKGHR